MKEAERYIQENKGKMQKVEVNFTSRQIALFRMLANDWGVSWQDVPAILIKKSNDRIMELENLQRAQTVN